MRISDWSSDVCSSDLPQQLVHDRAQVQLLGGDQREAFVEIEAHLPAEHAARAGAGAVGFFGAVLEHVAQQVEVLFHGDWGLGLGTGAASARGVTSTARRSEEHTSELQSLMRNSYAVFCLKKTNIYK